MKILTVKNYWESLSWNLDGIRIPNPQEIETVIIKNKPFKVTWKLETVPYDDHGHTYNSTSYHGYVKDTGILGANISLKELLDRKFVIRVKETT